MSTMQLKLDDIVVARQKLEAVGLLKTYYKKIMSIIMFIYYILLCQQMTF